MILLLIVPPLFLVGGLVFYQLLIGRAAGDHSHVLGQRATHQWSSRWGKFPVVVSLVASAGFDHQGTIMNRKATSGAEATGST